MCPPKHFTKFYLFLSAGTCLVSPSLLHYSQQVFILWKASLLVLGRVPSPTLRTCQGAAPAHHLYDTPFTQGVGAGEDPGGVIPSIRKILQTNLTAKYVLYTLRHCHKLMKVFNRHVGQFSNVQFL